jgi:hypothetical protein
MASQVLSGSSNVSYTNNTGQNVRIVINYMSGVTSGGSTTLTVNWAGVSATGLFNAIGRNLATSGIISTANNGLITSSSNSALPTELMLAPSQTFSAICGAYNIVVIPEAG